MKTKKSSKINQRRTNLLHKKYTNKLEPKEENELKKLQLLESRKLSKDLKKTINHLKKFSDEYKTNILSLNTKSHFRLYLKDGYFVESSCPRRGGLPEINQGTNDYEISATIQDICFLRENFFAILHTVLLDNISAYNGLMKQLCTDSHADWIDLDPLEIIQILLSMQKQKEE